MAIHLNGHSVKQFTTTTLEKTLASHRKKIDRSESMLCISNPRFVLSQTKFLTSLEIRMQSGFVFAQGNNMALSHTKGCIVTNTTFFYTADTALKI